MNKKVATLISYANLVISLIVTIFYTRILLRYVGDDYGVFSYSQSLISYLNLFQSTMVACFVRFATIESAQTKKEPKITNSIFLIILICLSFLALIVGFSFYALLKANVLSVSGFTSNQSTLLNTILVISIIHSGIEMILSFFYVYSTFRKQFIFVRLIALLNTILYPIFALISLKLGGGMLIVCIVMFTVKTMLSLVVFIYCFAKLKIKFVSISVKEFFNKFRDIFVFAGFILINTIVDTFNSSIDKILLGSFGTASLITTYQLGMTFSININSVSLALTNNYIPLIHELTQKGEKDKINKLFLKIGMFQTVILLMIVGGFIACGMPFIKLWVGVERIDAFYVASLLMFSLSFVCSYNISIEYQRSLNKHKARALIYVLAASVNLVTTLCLLLFVKTLNPIVSCLIGTIFSDLIFKWIVMPVYNQKVIGLPMAKHAVHYFEIVMVAFIAFVFSFGIQKMFPSANDVGLFLIGGFSFVLCYMLLIFVFIKTNTDWLELKKFIRIKDTD